jgi:hypothetical protein
VAVEIRMDEMAYIGLATSSHNATKTTTVHISNVTISGEVSPSGPFTESCDIPPASP